MDFKEVVNKRHSVRTYKDETVSDSVLQELVEIGRLAPSSRNKKPCSFIMVNDKEMLEKLAESKNAGSQMLKDAGGAIIVLGDSEKSDVWIEDCSIVMTYLHLACVDKGLGSCWIQIRNRKTKDYEDSGAYIKKLFDVAENQEVLAILSIGYLE